MSNTATPLYTNRAYALSYAKRGWPVFPLHQALGGQSCTCGNQCGNPGKHPRTKRGLKDATTDAAQINAWWTETPDAPIGIVCGDAQNLLVIDIDPRNGGDATWDRLVNEHGPIATVRVKTGGGGEHLYLRAPKVPVKSRGNALGAGVDISSNGHYIVAPPSLHASGSRYEFAPEAGLADIEPAECPDWVVELANAPRPKGKAKAKQDAPADTRGWLAVAFESWGRLGPWVSAAGAFQACCPWQHEHSDGRGDGQDSSCVVFPPTADRTMGWWKCEHAHCSTRSQDDVRRVIPESARRAADKAYPPKRQAQPEPTQHVATTAPPEHDPETGEVERSWREELIPGGTPGSTANCLANVLTILAHDERWQGVLAYDEFSDRIIWRKPPPWHPDDAPSVQQPTVSDEDAPRLSTWLHRLWRVKLSPDQCWAAIQVTAKRNTTHPVREYLQSLRWDRKLRCHRWTVDYLGSADTPYHRAVGLRWLVGAVARIMSPGCQMDAMLILEGPQNAGKSRSARTLAGADWYCDDIGDVRNKDSADALRGKWIVELGELASVRRADVEVQKAFLSRRIDHFRPAYGRVTVDRARQCVFLGTTNEDEYHTDPTGARRYWAVRVGAIDLPALERDRDQLWAEALYHHRQGEPHWLQLDEIRGQIEEQAQRRVRDPWEARILDWCDEQIQPVTIDRILDHCINIDPAKRTLADSRRIGAILRANGWEIGRKVGPREARVKAWVRA